MTIVAASRTVGIPTPITGTFKVSIDNSSCLFPTPPPGIIPVSDICIDLFILSIFFEHKLSIAITSLGFILSTIPFTISTVSMPVVPSTPGVIALILLVFLSIAFGKYIFICLVY